MGRTIEALLRLQVVETQLAALRRKREAKERRIAHHKRQVTLADAKLDERKQTAVERQKTLDALMLEVAATEEQVEKHREALNKAKTNKEYAAILAAMNMEKADNAKRESSILALMEEVQALKEDQAKIEEERAKLFEDQKRAGEALDEVDRESRDERTRLEASRNEFAEQIPPTTLSSFSRVAAHRDGEAMATVIKLHPKRDDYACSGCNLTVSLEVVNTLQTRDDLQTCRSCGRILYLEASTSRS